MAKVTFTKGKKSRNELRLPELHFIVADDWIKKLGEKAFCAWLRFHTWVDRTDEDRPYDKVPWKLERVAEKLGMSRTTLYRTIIIPLWEYGLIDLIEYEDSKKKGQKAVNIIVYESPMNLHETKVMPLVKLRDWKKDYGSTAQIYGLKGGRPKTKKNEAPIEEGTDAPDRFKNETVGEGDPDRFKNETVDRFKNETGSVSKMKPNNETNIFNNETNKNTNDTNTQQHKEEVGQDVVVVVQYQEMISNLFNVKPSEKTVKDLIVLAYEHGKDLAECIENTKKYMKKSGQAPRNPVGAIIYDIEYGWDLDSIKEQPQHQPQHEEEKLPEAVRLQMEREKAEKEQQQSEPQDEEKQNNANQDQEKKKESLAEKRARIQQKLKKMRDGLSTRGKRA